MNTKRLQELSIEEDLHNFPPTQAEVNSMAEIALAAEKLVRCKGRYHSEQNYRALAALFGVTVPDLEPPAGDGNCLAVPNGSGLIPVPDEFLSAKQNEHGLFELGEDCMVRLAVALAQQSKGMVIPARWKLVPVEPTEAMIEAGDLHMGGVSSLGLAWDAMLEASPLPHAGGDRG